MLNKIINKFGNTILFYANKDGDVVFKNFCLFKNDGNLYKLNMSKQEMGRILEYRFRLDNLFMFTALLIIIVFYLIFLKHNPTVINVLTTEFVTITAVFFARGIFGYLYDKKLQYLFGEYKVVDFNPPTSKEQNQSFKYNTYFNILVVIFFITIFLLLGFVYRFLIYKSLTLKNPKYDLSIKLTDSYNKLYPKTASLLDLSAYAKYKTKNYIGAATDYKTIFEIEGKQFEVKDFERFSNLLYLEKQINGTDAAIDTFNEYYTKKHLSVLDSIKMLWIKSIFSIENQRYDAVIYDYEEFEKSLKENDLKNRFYINCDKTYMYYLMGDYKKALTSYNNLINFAKTNKNNYKSDLKILYTERGFTKWKLGDIEGKNKDFQKSGIDLEKINAYEPSYQSIKFISPIKTKGKK